MFALVSIPLAPLVAIFRGQAAGETLLHDGLSVHRYDWPVILFVLTTPDERGPGGLYEPDIERAYRERGRWWCATVWLARNPGAGFAWLFGITADGYLDRPSGNGLVQRGRLWRWRRDIGPIRIEAGREVHRADYDATAENGPWIAIPFVSIRKVGDD
jgi:hypothetical protein